MKEEPITITRAGRTARCIACLVLCICLSMQVQMQTIALQAAAVQQDKKEAVSMDLNHDSVFLKQSQPHVCTLTSCAMMLRRAALLSGNQDWNKVTEQSIRKDAWAEGVGLKWNFTAAGFQVAQQALSSKSELINLLKSHPEGIVIYNTYKPHAILITDYTDGVFYCSDPSAGSPYGRYPVAQASITIESASRCWYIKPGAAGFTDTMTYKANNLTYRILDHTQRTVACTGAVKDKKVIVVPDVVKIKGEEYEVVQIAANAFAESEKLKDITIGLNVSSIGQEAFSQCSKLKTVKVRADHLEEIGENAFEKVHKAIQIIFLSTEQMERFAVLLNGTSVPQTASIIVQ